MHLSPSLAVRPVDCLTPQSLVLCHEKRAPKSGKGQRAHWRGFRICGHQAFEGVGNCPEFLLPRSDVGGPVNISAIPDHTACQNLGNTFTELKNFPLVLDQADMDGTSRAGAEVCTT